MGRSDPAPVAVIAGADEPGDRLVLTGRVLDADGGPVAGVLVQVFHTDAAGYYSEGGMDESDPRLCGVARTGDDGAYRFETVNPAAYATGGGGMPHVHYSVWSDTIRRSTHLLQLPWTAPAEAGDPARAGDGDRTARRRPLVRDDGGDLHAVRDLRLPR